MPEAIGQVCVYVLTPVQIQTMSNSLSNSVGTQGTEWQDTALVLIGLHGRRSRP